jgi:hypothetical protein
MNTFRKVFYILVVVMITSIGNVTAKGIIDSLAENFETIITLQARSIVVGGVSVTGGLLLKEELDKKNPVAVAVLASVAGCAIGKNAKAGLVAGTTSIVISGVDYCLSDNIKKDVSGNLPHCLTSKGAKIVAQVVVATTVGYYFGKEA